MNDQSDPDVLVVGAGPVGLVAALFLEQYGVRAQIVDMHRRTTQHSYALAIHPGTLRMLDEAGLSDAVIDAGRRLTRVAYYEGPQRRAEIDDSAIARTEWVVQLATLPASGDEIEPLLGRVGLTTAATGADRRA